MKFARIEFLDLAKKDLTEGHRFYESQQPGLGAYFLDSLSTDIESLCKFAGIHRKVYKDYHRLLSKRFPFAVFYRVVGGRVFIHAVVDCRRDPVLIKGKLK